MSIWNNGRYYLISRATGKDIPPTGRPELSFHVLYSTSLESAEFQAMDQYPDLLDVYPAPDLEYVHSDINDGSEKTLASSREVRDRVLEGGELFVAIAGRLDQKLKLVSKLYNEPKIVTSDDGEYDDEVIGIVRIYDHFSIRERGAPQSVSFELTDFDRAHGFDRIHSCCLTLVEYARRGMKFPAEV